MKIADIRWLDADGDEAEVKVVSEVDESLALWAYCHPCKLEQGRQLSEPLSTLGAKVVSAGIATPSIIRQKMHSWSYVLTGQAVDLAKGLVAVNDIVVEIGSHTLPGDIRTGDWVECVCSRLGVSE
ncbi:MAG: hypothetical protein ACQEVA_01145 [Myxococcota bacterium]